MTTICNCKPKIAKLDDRYFRGRIGLLAYKTAEQVTIPRACPIHQAGETYLTRLGLQYVELPKTSVR